MSVIETGLNAATNNLEVQSGSALNTFASGTQSLRAH